MFSAYTLNMITANGLNDKMLHYWHLVYAPNSKSMKAEISNLSTEKHNINFWLVLKPGDTRYSYIVDTLKKALLKHVFIFLNVIQNNKWDDNILSSLTLKFALS